MNDYGMKLKPPLPLSLPFKDHTAHYSTYPENLIEVIIDKSEIKHQTYMPFTDRCK